MQQSYFNTDAFTTHKSKEDHQQEDWLYQYRFSKCQPPGWILKIKTSFYNCVLRKNLGESLSVERSREC